MTLFLCGEFFWCPLTLLHVCVMPSAPRPFQSASELQAPQQPPAGLRGLGGEACRTAHAQQRRSAMNHKSYLTF